MINISAIKHKILLRTLKVEKDVDPNEILFCKADGSYSDIFLRDGKAHKVCQNLKSMKDFLHMKKFCRCHHSYLINRNEITGFDITGKKLIIAEKYVIPISRRKLREIRFKLKAYSNQKIIS
jgi:two-component system LytT family response regulator